MVKNIPAGMMERPLRFIALWMLTMIIPELLLVAGRGAILAGWLPAALDKGRFVLPVVVWFLVGYLQSLLLGSILRRRAMWTIATFVGGGLGALAILYSIGYPRQITAVAMLSFGTPDWVSTTYLLSPFAIGGAIGTGIMGIAQSVCLTSLRRERMLWICASAISGATAFAASITSSSMIDLITPTSDYDLMIAGDAMPYLVNVFTAMLVGTLVYGLLTGIAMQRLLRRRNREQEDVIAKQFD